MARKDFVVETPEVAHAVETKFEFSSSVAFNPGYLRILTWNLCGGVRYRE